MKILIVGGGSIGKRHLTNIKKISPDASICVMKRVYDKPFAQAYGVSVITTFQEAKGTLWDAIIVANPTSHHYEVLHFACINGFPIFMEKPLTHSPESFQEATRLLKQYPVLFFIGFMLRYHPFITILKDVIDSGKLGTPYSARFEFGSYLPNWHPYEDHRISYASRTDLGGGVINTITHELDLLLYFFGEPDSVYCSKKNTRSLGIEVEEMADAIFDYDSFTATIHIDYLQKDYSRNVTVLFENGRADWHWSEKKLVLQPHKDKPIIYKENDNFETNDLYLAEMNHFFQLLKMQNMNHELDFECARINTKWMLLMHESALKGCKVK